MAGSSERIRQLKEQVARQELQPEETQGEDQAVLIFALEQQRYAFPLTAVREIHRLGEITSIPGLPPVVLGAVGLRGEVLPVIDLHQLLGMAEQTPSPDSRLVVIQHETVRAAFVADQVQDIAGLPAAALQPPPAGTGGEVPSFVQAIARQGPKTTYLLDAARLLEAVRHGR